MRKLLILSALLISASLVQAADTIRVYSVEKGEFIESTKVIRSSAEWRRILTPEQFHILREEGTERAYSHPLHDHKEKGIYRCAGCGLDLFHSDAKYDSKSGWPSYYRPVAEENIGSKDDFSFFTRRTEVHCIRCGGHLGHVFEDGPKPTGLRYCINGYALTFTPLP